MSEHLDFSPFFAVHFLFAKESTKERFHELGRQRSHKGSEKRGWIPQLGLGIQAGRGLEPLVQPKKWEEPGPPCTTTGSVEWKWKLSSGYTQAGGPDTASQNC